MCRQTMAIPMCMHSGFPTRRSEQMIMTSFHDITRISHAIEGGTMKGEHNQTSRLSSESSGTKCLSLLTSHRPSTSAVSVPLMEKSIPRMECVTCLSICMYPDLSGDLSVSVNLVI